LPESGGFVIIGMDDPLPNLKFDNADAMQNFLPQQGPNGPILISQIDPTTSTAGRLAGELLALFLNIQFSIDGILPPGFAQLQLRKSGSLDGLTVMDAMIFGNLILSNQPQLPMGYTIDLLTSLLNNINSSYLHGKESDWAKSHLS